MIDDFKNYIKGNKNLVYEDKNITDIGINYLKPIYINNQYILNNMDKFQEERLRLLFYIYFRGYKNKYLHTTLNIIMKDLKTTRHIILKNLNDLNDIKLINIYDENFKLLNDKIKDINKIINLELNINCLITNEFKEDYLYLPFEYINNAIMDLNGKEFILLIRLILLNNFYNYYTKNYEDIKKSMRTNLKHEIFSYTRMVDEAKYMKINKTYMNNFIESLETKGYINVGQLEHCYFLKGLDTIKILDRTVIYQVVLFTRLEYIYYYNLVYKCVHNETKEYLKKQFNKDLKWYKNILSNKTELKEYQEYVNNFTNEKKGVLNLEKDLKKKRQKKDNHKTTYPIPAKIRLKLLNESARWVESEQKYIPACQFCGKTALESTLHIDHIIPYSKGGETVEENLQVLCEECNEQKNNTYKLIINK